MISSSFSDFGDSYMHEIQSIWNNFKLYLKLIILKSTPDQTQLVFCISTFGKAAFIMLYSLTYCKIKTISREYQNCEEMA